MKRSLQLQEKGVGQSFTKRGQIPYVGFGMNVPPVWTQKRVDETIIFNPFWCDV